MRWEIHLDKLICAQHETYTEKLLKRSESRLLTFYSASYGLPKLFVAQNCLKIGLKSPKLSKNDLKLVWNRSKVSIVLSKNWSKIIEKFSKLVQKNFHETKVVKVDYWSFAEQVTVYLNLIGTWQARRFSNFCFWQHTLLPNFLPWWKKGECLIKFAHYWHF